jgi:hydrogenase nickel insertion protein HypA
LIFAEEKGKELAMHELTMAQSIIEAVTLEAEKNRARVVKEVNIDVGELMQLDAKALSEALKLLLTGPKLQNAKVLVHVRKATFSCAKCGTKWDMRETKKQLSSSVPDSLLVREPDSKEFPLHFLPYLSSSFLHCPDCGSSDIATSEGEDVKIRRIVME